MSDSVTLYIAGDSTAAAKLPERRPETGWGEAFARLVAPLRVENRALNGRSSRSFIEEGHLDSIAAAIRAGDFLLVQFGHNDSKLDSERHTDPEREFPSFLARYAEVAREAGAQAVFLTPIVRRHFAGSVGFLADSHGPYLAAVRRFAAERGLPLLDLESRTRDLVSSLGPEGSEGLFLHLAPGESPNYPEGIADDTHLSPEGAERVAALVLDEILRAVPLLAGAVFPPRGLFSGDQAPFKSFKKN